VKRVRRVRTSNTERATAAITSLPNDKAPGLTSWPRCLIATKAEAHNTRVTVIAAGGCHAGGSPGRFSAAVLAVMVT